MLTIIRDDTDTASIAGERADSDSDLTFLLLLLTGSRRRSNDGLRTGGSSCSYSPVGVRGRAAAAFFAGSGFSFVWPFSFARSLANSLSACVSSSRFLRLAFGFAFATLNGLPSSGGSCGNAAGLCAFDLAAVDFVEEEK